MTKKSAFSSLRTKQLLVLLVAFACAAAAYFAANWIGDTLIEKVYLDQKAMQKRERAIVSELQTYVQENRISSRDTDAVARWSMSKSDTYVMLYRNQRLAFEAGWWGVDDVDEADAPPLLSNSAGVYPIYFTDGPMQAVVYDFSESRLYTLTTIVSVLIGCFVLMCFMLSYNGRITRTIVTIAAEVEQIGRGDLTARLEKPRGNDELAGLTESVERMRASLLHKTEEFFLVDHGIRAVEGVIDVAVAENIDAALVVRIAHADANEEAVELGAGQERCASRASRVLGCEDDEGRREVVGLTVDGDAVFLHRFQKGGLRLAGGTVDLVREEEVGHDRAGLVDEGIRRFIVHRVTDDIRGDGVRGKLNAAGVES